MRALLALWLGCSLALALPALAQTAAPGSIVSPDRSAVNERQLLETSPRIEGRIDIPDQRASVLMQPAGRRWQHFRTVQLQWLGGVVLLGMLALLALAHFVKGGREPIAGGRSGSTLVRFTPLERFSHWLTAVSFVLLALTGLTLTFGRYLFLSAMGAEAFSAWARWSKYVHNFVSFAFVLGLILIFALWLKDNLPRQVDLDWLKAGGGFVKSRHAPAGRFNAGEKGVFWLAMLGGLAVTISGIYLLFPFFFTNIAGMQTAQVMHAIVAMLFIALILAHAYMGTLAQEGNFESMGTGNVDVNWMKEHHDQWLADEIASGRLSEVPPAPPARLR